mmetsp:Transcript_17909/g.51334  ORF Transcript_17909/g.51334 Transcript_17909/m.51334 type:complete len:202 (+) Transcript_17909:2329-2934(+)
MASMLRRPLQVVAWSMFAARSFLPNTCCMARWTLGSYSMQVVIIGVTSVVSGYVTLSTWRRLRGKKVTRPSFSCSKRFIKRAAVASVSTTTWNRLFSAATSMAVLNLGCLMSKFSIRRPWYCSPTRIPSCCTMVARASRPWEVARGITLRMLDMAFWALSWASVTRSDSSSRERHCSFLDSAISLRSFFFSSMVLVRAWRF